MAEVVMPALGESVSEGTINAWLKQPGDRVEVDEPLLEVSTDKVDTEIPAPFAGTVSSLLAAEGDVVGVGSAICLIETSTTVSAVSQDGPKPSAASVPHASPAPAAARLTVATPAVPSAAASRSVGSFLSQPVRRTAETRGIDPSTLEGTGRDGRVRLGDVLAVVDRNSTAATLSQTPSSPVAPAAVPTPPPAQPIRQAGPSATVVPPERPMSPVGAVRTEPLTRRRRIIAERMVASLQQSAQLTSFVEVDLTLVARQIASLREEFSAREGVRLTFSPYIARAALDALKEHPSFNAQLDLDRNQVSYFAEEHLAIAVDTEAGLVTPVIRSAGDLSIAGLARKISDVGARARTNKLSPDEMQGGTFTLTNTGSRGVLADTPIINQPQVAILGAGAVVKRAVVMDDPRLGETIAVRHMAYMSLTYDHRLIDGADAARYLGTLRQRLETPPVDV
ncbi:2-oxoglutarate dehydrogenase, E2 component, dihydrolipoamide succinyltransferase [Nocardioides cavernae]|uniref:Dihydrolipoamide acetyltransferase component of pyruvate dehydrogenase complex n=1 Tax=Nocardioides cavernae TaxID=1921566 RepID=A0ABR8N7T5_9ACTN|nr:2-oxoglutarate dehydrogenase, E2 component, dihydrolipoamide succinyltransferase [Nocardioides cavernae]MBD3924219.1 2-oxoglutarate dehydrogenase, E2 component, dihydrolipoamide succinyltransferase [Nocardioides cavernae]MBM7510842.1 2-oxoglutarate dehydrogenase E2 component (dihydrolipoamide succinyltransferase) [Nocardioides cavernae]